jgi:hypothetical protein
MMLAKVKFTREMQAELCLLLRFPGKGTLKEAFKLTWGHPLRTYDVGWFTHVGDLSTLRHEIRAWGCALWIM